MALQITGIKRVFKLKDKKIDLPDPNETMTPEDVQKFYCGKYPELTNASINGPKIVGSTAEYSFTTTVGTKG